MRFPECLHRVRCHRSIKPCGQGLVPNDCNHALATEQPYALANIRRTQQLKNASKLTPDSTPASTRHTRNHGARATHVSPVMDALCASDPLPPNAPVSTYFLALSHAPPALLRKSAMRMPDTVANISMLATTRAPSRVCPVKCPSNRNVTPALAPSIEKSQTLYETLECAVLWLTLVSKLICIEVIHEHVPWDPRGQHAFNKICNRPATVGRLFGPPNEALCTGWRLHAAKREPRTSTIRARNDQVSSQMEKTSFLQHYLLRLFRSQEAGDNSCPRSVTAFLNGT